MAEKVKLIGELLTRLELREAALIEWGFYEVSHSTDEIAELFANDPDWGSAFQDMVGGSEALFIDDLAGSHLLHRVSDGYPQRYRSRFAESVRLLARLKQRFRADDWPHAPALVSQVRLHLTSRKFPRRNQDFGKVWSSISSACWLPHLQRQVVEALVGDSSPILLAAFQTRAIARILDHYRGTSEPTGTVVTAGTGGGKTKAFYIPALMGIAADVHERPAFATRVLAIYPRNVLLADQFAEAASQASKINQARLISRHISVGVLTGEVPYNANFESFPPNKWALTAWPSARYQAGRLLPHLRHPETGEQLVWTDADRRAGLSMLRRDTTEGEIVFPDGAICLTREELVRRPPDIFLTSIEMLNKELSGEIGRAVLGFGASASNLRMVLLDELHTYEGLTGAQVPWILRRLAHWCKPSRRDRQIHYVGLSATLQRASEHLAVLTGVQATRIEEIAPQDTDEERAIEGQEYNVVLKAHPGSGAGVLSTSIQTAMLGARVLTPAAAPPMPQAEIDPATFYGRKVFGFTDNLDVANRWLPDLKHAEQVLRLARLREPHDGDELKDAAGQIWQLPQDLGHNLQARLQIDRISSQDPGIDNRADIVIATSSLEVGYDDPEVGMVLQHKAPRSSASFLQRKGRAGRRQGMRPWTIVVLSDHGRDRWVFRDSEQLFNPVLDRLSLPVFNPYLLRIQATWFFVDWIAARIGKHQPTLYLTRQAYHRADVQQLVEALIESEALQKEFTQSLELWLGARSGGFRVPDPSGLARSILWSPPRAVLRHVVPDLRRFIANGYVQIESKARLLPRFLPGTTWDVLDTQDVELLLNSRHEGPRAENLDARRALFEAAPGRVSRRFVVQPRHPSQWLAFSIRLLDESPPSGIAVDDLCTHWALNSELGDLNVFQPTVMSFSAVPESVKNSSNAQWDWKLRVRHNSEGGLIGLHTAGVLAQLFEDSRTWLHRDQNALHAHWYAQRCRYEIHLKGDQVRRGTLSVLPPAKHSDLAAASAVGFSRSVDGIQLVLRAALLDSAPDLPEAVQKELRTAYFRYRASKSELLRASASDFTIASLCASTLGMLVATALRQRLNLEQAWAAIPDKSKAAAKVMRSILSIDGESHEDSNRRLAQLLDLWKTSGVATEVDSLVQVLWAPLGDDFRDWLRNRFIETVRAAVEEAVYAVLPEASEGSLLVEALHEQNAVSILILESDPGGVGFVERLLLAMTSEPEHFSGAIQWTISDCPSEETLTTVLRANRAARATYEPMRAAFDEVRGAGDYRSLENARRSLIAALEQLELAPSKRNVTSLLSKALGPGTNRQTERWLDGLTRARHRAVKRVGAAVDSRSYAFWLSGHPKATKQMRATLRSILGVEPDDSQLYQAFLRLTLEPCTDSCPECLGTEGEAMGLSPSRRLAQIWLGARPMHVIQIDDTGDWSRELLATLQQESRVRLRHRADQRSIVAGTLATIMTSEIDRGTHSSPLRVVGVRTSAGYWETDVEVDPWSTR
jgi:Helicase conserved C-terminal domain